MIETLISKDIVHAWSNRLAKQQFGIYISTTTYVKFFFFFFPFFGSDILIHSCWEEAVLLSFLSVSYLKSNNQVPRKLVADCLGLGSI